MTTAFVSAPRSTGTFTSNGEHNMCHVCQEMREANKVSAHPFRIDSRLPSSFPSRAPKLQPLAASMPVTLLERAGGWGVWMGLLISTALGWEAQRHTNIGKMLSSSMMTFIFAMILSNLGIAPAEAPAYNLLWKVFVPLAVPCLLYGIHLCSSMRRASTTVKAFFIGAMGTIIGALVAFFILPFDPMLMAHAAGLFTATYIGGTINFLAVATALSTPAGIVSAGVAADMILMGLYCIFAFWLATSPKLNRIFARRQRHATELSRPATATQLQDTSCVGHFASTSGVDSEVAGSRILSALSVSALLCTIAQVLARGNGVIAVPLITLLSLLWNSMFPARSDQLSHTGMLIGSLLMKIFFAGLGMSANVQSILITHGPQLVIFGIVLLFVHFLVTLAGCYLLRLPLQDTLLASNACIGGPSAAAAMASSFGWDPAPGILCGSMGYALATFVGIGMATLLGASLA